MTSRTAQAESKAMPHDLEAERVVLGSVLLDNTAVSPANAALRLEFLEIAAETSFDAAAVPAVLSSDPGGWRRV